MKIAVFSDCFFPQTNGVVTHIAQSTSLLAKKHEIMLFVPKPAINIDDGVKKNLSDKIRIIYIPSIPFPIYEHWRLTSIINAFDHTMLNTFDPDIVHFHTQLTVGYGAIRYAKKKHIPLVGSFHGYFMEPEYLAIVGLDKVGLHKSKMLNKLLWKYSNFFYNNTDAVVCPSFATKTDLIKHNITRPIHVVSNGIDTLSINNNKINNDYFSKFLPKKYLLYVGRVSKEKSIDNILQAYSTCMSSIQDDLVIVGNGPELDNLKKLANQLQITTRVHFLGHVDHAMLIHSAIFKKATAFITASTSETQGITILEAMATGLPIIGVDAKAIPELVDENGIICQPNNIEALADAIKQISRNPKLQLRFSNNSLVLVKNHTLDKTVEKLEKIYMSLL